MSKKSKDEEKAVEMLVEPTFDEDGVQATSGIGVDGKEYPDPVPMAPPLGYTAPPDLLTMIRTMVRSEELRRTAEAEGFDTFEEAEDFEIEDDPLDPLTEYERVFEPPAVPPAGPQKAAAPVGAAAEQVIPAPVVGEADSGSEREQSRISDSQSRHRVSGTERKAPVP